MVSYVEADENGTPAHLIVQTYQSVSHPQAPASQLVRVNLQYVRGIDWGKKHLGSDESKSILLMDGRRFAYRGLKWSSDSLQVLTSNGVHRFSFAAIASLRIPDKDFWNVYCQEIAGLCPADQVRLIRIETATGLRLTGSEARFDAATVVSPEQLRRQATLKSAVVRLQQQRRLTVNRQKMEQTKLTQKLREYERKRDQQLRKLRNDIRKHAKPVEEATARRRRPQGKRI